MVFCTGHMYKKAFWSLNRSQPHRAKFRKINQMHLVQKAHLSHVFAFSGWICWLKPLTSKEDSQILSKKLFKWCFLIPNCFLKRKKYKVILTTKIFYCFSKLCAVLKWDFSILIKINFRSGADFWMLPFGFALSASETQMGPRGCIWPRFHIAVYSMAVSGWLHHS